MVASAPGTMIVSSGSSRTGAPSNSPRRGTGWDRATLVAERRGRWAEAGSGHRTQGWTRTDRSRCPGSREGILSGGRSAREVQSGQDQDQKGTAGAAASVGRRVRSGRDRPGEAGTIAVRSLRGVWSHLVAEVSGRRPDAAALVALPARMQRSDLSMTIRLTAAAHCRNARSPAASEPAAGLALGIMGDGGLEPSTSRM